MKPIVLMRAFTIAAFASLSSVAQQPSQPPAQQPLTAEMLPPKVDAQANISGAASVQSAVAPAVPVAATANSPEIVNPELRPVAAELVSRIDSRNAKTGDSIVIRTTATATIANGIEIPKGSKIVGRITDVEAKGKTGDDSRVAIQFDQAELKGGQNLSIRSVIQSVAPGSVAGSANAESKGGSPADQAASGSPNPAGRRPQPAAAVTANSSNAPTGAPAGEAQPVGTVVAQNGNVAIRTTAIPGVLLAGNVNGQPFSNASGAFLGARRDVHLEGGTTMIIAVATAPSGANAR